MREWRRLLCVIRGGHRLCSCWICADNSRAVCLREGGHGAIRRNGNRWARLYWKS